MLLEPVHTDPNADRRLVCVARPFAAEEVRIRFNDEAVPAPAQPLIEAWNLADRNAWINGKALKPRRRAARLCVVIERAQDRKQCPQAPGVIETAKTATKEEHAVAWYIARFDSAEHRATEEVAQHFLHIQPGIDPA